MAEHARVHYQIIGLRDVDPEQIRRELAATNEDGVAVIARPTPSAAAISALLMPRR